MHLVTTVFLVKKFTDNILLCEALKQATYLELMGNDLFSSFIR